LVAKRPGTAGIGRLIVTVRLTTARIKRLAIAGHGLTLAAVLENIALVR
jgi:hypothetical protein